MRLAIVSQQGRKASGAEHALMEFISRLPPSVECRWFFFEDGEFAQAIRRRFASVTIVKMSERVANAQRGGLPLNASIDSVLVAAKLARELARARPDLVLTNSMKAHVIGSLAARAARLRCVNYIHDVVEGKALALLRFVSGLCATERLTCSALVKKQLALPNTTVVYAAIDVGLFAELPDRLEARQRLGLPETSVPIIGLVGRIARWKGQDRFIRIASSVLAQRAAHFCIVGSPIFGCDTEYVDSLHEEVARRGLQDHVTFVPWQESMEHVYAAIDIACNCSTREPFGRTTLEALASGVPSVCFDDAGICEIFNHQPGATAVRAGDEQAFARAIVSYLDGTETSLQARVGARTIAKQMDLGHAYAVFISALECAAGMKLDTSGASARFADAEPAAAVVAR